MDVQRVIMWALAFIAKIPECIISEWVPPSIGFAPLSTLFCHPLLHHFPSHLGIPAWGFTWVPIVYWTLCIVLRPFSLRTTNFPALIQKGLVFCALPYSAYDTSHMSVTMSHAKQNSWMWQSLIKHGPAGAAGISTISLYLCTSWSCYKCPTAACLSAETFRIPCGHCTNYSPILTRKSVTPLPTLTSSHYVLRSVVDILSWL